jgi:hypothetical protein
MVDARRRAKQAQPADLTETAILQAAVRTVDSKQGNWWFYHGDTARVFRRPSKTEKTYFGLRVTSAWIVKQAHLSTHL